MKIYKQLPDKTKKLEPCNFSQEAYLEGFLLDNPNIFEMPEDIIILLDRQVVFPHTQNKIDILLLNAKAQEPEIIIVEIKKDKATKKEVKQLVEYIEKWRQEHSGVLNKYKDTLSKYKLNENLEQVKGILVATEFDDSLEEEFKKQNIQGIQVNRYSADDYKEFFIFVDYVPPLSEKWAKKEIGKDSFWKKSGRKKHKDEVESILQELKEIIFTFKYWGTTITIYDENENSVAWYTAGDASIQIKGKGRIKLTNKSEIIKATIETRKEAA